VTGARADRREPTKMLRKLGPGEKEAIRRRAQGETLAELARSYDVSRATISRLAVDRIN
jgi:hypothetical protein